MASDPITVCNTPMKEGRAFRNIGKKYTHMSTWSYENRVIKHSAIFLNFPCLMACLLCCLLMSFFFFACFVVIIRDLCRSGWRQNYYLTIDRITIFANYLSCYVSLNQALFCCSSLMQPFWKFLDWNDPGLKLCEVRLLNKCSKICVIFNLDSLECFKRPLSYCPTSGKGF